MLSHIKFTNLPVSDQARALDFYTRVLGLEVRQDSPYGEGTRWIELGVPGARTSVVFTQRTDTKPGTIPALMLVADDVKATATQFARKGAEIAAEPQAAPWDPQAIWCWLRDTEGNIVMLQNR